MQEVTAIDKPDIGLWSRRFEHQHLDTPLNCDIDEVVPGKLQAMKSPRDLPGGAQWLDVHRQDGSFSHRDFQQ